MDMRNLRKPWEVRWARIDEWKPAMDMIWRTFLRYEGKEYPPKSVENFHDFITGDELYEDFLRGEYLLMVAVDGGRVVGAGSIRDGNYLSLLFVDEAYHRRGIGSLILRKLCEYLELETEEGRMSLEAASMAVEFYRKQGFCVVRPEAEVAGVRLTSMEKVF